MTEMAFELGWIITDKGGLRRSNINDLNHALRRMLWNRGDCVRPIELVNQRLHARPLMTTTRSDSRQTNAAPAHLGPVRPPSRTRI